MKTFLKICKRKYVLTALLCFGFILAGFSVSGIRAQAGATMSVEDFTGNVVVEKGTTVLPREGRKVSIYSYPAGGKYLYESVDSWEADHTYYVKDPYSFQSGTDSISLYTMYLDNLTMSQSSLDMVVGQTQSMRDIYIKEPAESNEKIIWTSDDENVIKPVNAYGMFEAIGPGSATITGISEYSKKTVSCTITVTSDVPTPPSGGGIENTTDPNTNEGGAVLDETLDSLSEKVLTEEDRQKIATGANVSIRLVVTEAENWLNDQEKELLQSGRGKNTLGMYLLISLQKIFEGEDIQAVSEPNGAIGIQLQVPESLLNTDSTKKREYSILRVHNGVVDTLPCTFDPDTKMLSFKSDRFSPYAIVYNDTAKGDDNTGGNTGGNNGNTTGGNTDNTDNTNTSNTASDNSGSSTVASTSTAAAAAVKDEVPKTGESGQAFFWILLALCAVTGVMCLGKKRITGKK